MNETDCRTEEGITVGLIDSLIFISRVLAKRDMGSREVQEALKDFYHDEDFRDIYFSAFRCAIPLEETGCSECSF